VSTDDEASRALLAELQNIADAVRQGTLELTSFRSRRENGEVPKDQAMPLLEYQAVKELLGQLSTDDGSRIWMLTVDRLGLLQTGQILRVSPPRDAAVLAVYTGPGKPAEYIDLTQPNPNTTDDFPVKLVPTTTPITRLVFFREDGYPIALGPRLPAI
jgi:hypothetical protein